MAHGPLVSFQNSVENNDSKDNNDSYCYRIEAVLTVNCVKVVV